MCDLCVFGHCLFTAGSRGLFELPVDAAATKLQSAHKGKSTRTGGALLEAAIKKDDLGAVTKLLKDG